WGLFVGLIGFVVTIYTLFETQRVTRKAQREVQAATVEAQQKIAEAARQTQEAVKQAQEETRQILERVRQSVREADCSTPPMWVRELRTATTESNWHRALFFAEECPAVLERLRNASGLEESERQGLSKGIDTLRLVREYIRNNRLNTTMVGLAPNHAKSLEALAALVEQIGGRLFHEPTKGSNP